MAQIYNSDLKKELIDGAKIQIEIDAVPSALAEKVVPVMEVNPKLLRKLNVHKRNQATNVASTTIYATPTNKDFYLTALSLSVTKDVTSTSATSSIQSKINGIDSILLEIRGITLTVQSDSVSLSLPAPIKLDRGVNVLILNGSADANISASGIIFGYTVED